MTDEIKVLIIEDEEVWSKNLAASLHDFGYSIAGIADTFEAAIHLLNTTIYDIVLLDININNKISGIEIGKMLHTLYKKPYVFISASTEHTLSAAIDAHPSAYLNKPVQRSSLIATIQGAIFNFKTHITPVFNTPVAENSLFFVKWGSKFKKLNWTDIVFLRSEKNYTYLFNAPDKSEYCFRSTLAKTLNFIIPDFLRPNFVQVNRAEAVNLNFLQELNAEEIRTGFKTLTLTEGFAAQLKKSMNVLQ